MNNFKEIEKRVTNIVNKVDPDNLVSYGAPVDEYQTQVHHIISILSRIKDKTLWEKEFHQTFFPKERGDIQENKQNIKQLTDLIKSEFPTGVRLS